MCNCSGVFAGVDIMMSFGHFCCNFVVSHEDFCFFDISDFMNHWLIILIFLVKI